MKQRPGTAPVQSGDPGTIAFLLAQIVIAFTTILEQTLHGLGFASGQDLSRRALLKKVVTTASGSAAERKIMPDYTYVVLSCCCFATPLSSPILVE